MESINNQGIGQSHHNEFEPPTPHCILMISTLFCMLGGALIILSGTLSWVVDGGASTIAINADEQWFITDLMAMNGFYNLFIVALVGGAMAIAFSIICLLTEKTHKRATWLVVAIVTAFATTVIVATIILWINGDLAAISEEAAFGPAPFIAVFGCVLTLAGGLVLTLNAMQELQKHPVKRISKPPRPVATVPEEEYPRPNGQYKCPGCRSPVGDTWEVCPVCGTKLSGPLL